MTEEGSESDGGVAGGDAGGSDVCARVGEESAAAREDHGRPCPQCGATLVHRHCEYVCPNHGVIMDCSDTFY
ncbi:HVO_2523 family zinc finger protein [Halobaculum sp. MBLA0147]|uniref:HVO_2523 family zinc finger protein n=1 Tax=Halobaculum sp. MBLA0147 TaxID=3079934 RepID=UPI003526B213